MRLQLRSDKGVVLRIKEREHAYVLSTQALIMRQWGGTYCIHYHAHQEGGSGRRCSLHKTSRGQKPGFYQKLKMIILHCYFYDAFLWTFSRLLDLFKYPTPPGRNFTFRYQTLPLLTGYNRLLVRRLRIYLTHHALCLLQIYKSLIIYWLLSWLDYTWYLYDYWSRQSVPLVIEINND